MELGDGALVADSSSSSSSAGVTNDGGFSFNPLDAFDDIMNTEEPYYVRVGGESLIKARDRAAAAAARARRGPTSDAVPLSPRLLSPRAQGIQEVLPLMHVGDVWDLKLKPELAFGAKGRPPSPGKPRIPGGAVVDYQVELVSFPGGEGDLFLERDDI